MKLKKAANLFHFDRMIDHLVGFVETRLEILKLDFKEESVKVIAKLLTMAVIGLLGTLFFIFFSVMIAIMLNQALDSPYLGFAILAAFFLVLLIGVLIVKQTNWYHNKITTITDQIVEDSNNKQDERENSPEITGINP
jgi:uncharacterized membrane protein YqjE